jgi:hypothetical protein
LPNHPVGTAPEGYHSDDAEILAAGVTGHPLDMIRPVVQALRPGGRKRITHNPWTAESTDVALVAAGRDQT